MPLIVKRSLIGISLLIAIVLAALFGVNSYVQSDGFKQTLIEKVADQTGRTLTIDGNFDISLYPWLGLDIGQVRLSNAEGFANTPFLQANRIRTRIKTLPLLNGRYELDTLLIDQAEIYLEQKADSSTNWDDFLSTPESAGEDTGAARQPLELPEVIIGGIDIQAFRLSWYRHGATPGDSAQQLDISQFNVSTDPLTLGEPVKLQADLKVKSTHPAIAAKVNFTADLNYNTSDKVYSAQPLSLAATLTGDNIPGGETELAINTGVTLDLGADTFELASLTFSALGTETRAEVQAQNIQSKQPSAQVDVGIQGDNLALLLKVLEIQPLADKFVQYPDQDFKLSSQLTLEGDTVTIEEFSADLLQAEFQANLIADSIRSASLSARGSIDAQGDNLPLIIEVLEQFQTATQSSNLSQQLKGLPDPSFRFITEFDSDLDNGLVQISTLSARMLGADINGTINASGLNQETPAVEGMLNASGPSLPKLIGLVGTLQQNPSLTDVSSRLANLSNPEFNIDTEFNTTQGVNATLTAELLGLNIQGQLNSKGEAITGRFNLTGTELKELLKAYEVEGIGNIANLKIEADISGSQQDIQLTPLRVSAKVSTEGRATENVALSGNTRINLEDKSLSVDKLSLSGLGLKATGKLAATDIDQDPNLQGSISVASFNPRALMQKLKQPLPTTADSSVLKRMTLSSQFSGNSDAIRLQNLKVKLDDSTLTGQTSIQNFAKPAVNFSFAIDSINTDRYLPPETEVAQKDKGNSNTELPVKTLRNLDMNGDFKIASLQYSNLKLSQVELKMKAKNGLIELAPAKASLYEGTYTGSVGLDARTNQVKLSFDTELSGIQSAPLLQDYLGEAQLSGVGDISLSLSSTGANINALTQNLSGKGEVQFSEGIFYGVDAKGILKQVELMIQRRRFDNVEPGEQTAFDSLSATLNIDEGIIRNQDMLLSAPGFQVRGEGIMANLRNETWNYGLTVSVDESTEELSEEESYDLGGYSIPVRCQGRIDQPRCLPDVSTLARNFLREAGRTAITGLLGGLLGRDEEPEAEQEGETSSTEQEANNSTPNNQNKTEEPEKPRDALKGLLEGLLR